LERVNGTSMSALGRKAVMMVGAPMAANDPKRTWPDARQSGYGSQYFHKRCGSHG